MNDPSSAPPRSPDGDLRPPYLWATVAGFAVFVLYAITLAPNAAFWDASEYTATAWMMGIPHPPGNPLFVVLGRAWTILLEPTGLSVPVRVNLFSAFMSASAHAFWFLVVHHVLRYFSGERTFRLVGAGAAVLVSATAFTVWNQSNVNEKVYTVSLLTIALLSWLIIRWQERLGKGGDDNILVLMVFILALSVGNHLMAFLAAPAIALFLLLVNPRVLLNWKLYPPVLVAALLGLSIHLFLPLRAQLDPTINQGAPECAEFTEALLSVATYGNAGCEALSSSLTRQQYKVEGEPGPGLTGPRQAPIGSQYANYLQYFDWQWARSVQAGDTLFPIGRLLFTVLFTALGVWGATEHWSRDRLSFAYVGTLFATLSIGLVWYLNFKYGYSMPEPTGAIDAREVRERDYFFLVSFSIWGLWVGVGIAAIWESLSRKSGRLIAGAPVLALAVLPLALNWSWASRANDHAARDWAYNLLMSVEPYGVLFTSGDNDTFPLWYLQETEGIRRDVQVIVGSYLNTGWYAKQIRDLTEPCPEGVDPEATPTRIVCQRPYQPVNGVRYGASPGDESVLLLTEEPVRTPERGTLALDDATIDQVAGTGLILPDDRVFQLGPVQAVIRSGTQLLASHQFTLALIRNAVDDRPIYFSSSRGMAFELGLTPHLVREGLAFRLDARSPMEIDGVVQMPEGAQLTMVTGPWLSDRRTRQLLDEVFVHRGGLPDWSFWPDRPSIGIPNYYAWAYLAVAQAALQEGDADALELYRDEANRWGELGGT